MTPSVSNTTTLTSEGPRPAGRSGPVQRDGLRTRVIDAALFVPRERSRARRPGRPGRMPSACRPYSALSADRLAV